MSDFSVDFTKSYARRRPEEFGAQGVDGDVPGMLVMRFDPVKHTNIRNITMLMGKLTNFRLGHFQ